MHDVYAYKACDRAIKEMDRESLKDFGQLKLANWDSVSIIRTVLGLYRRSKKKADDNFYEIAFEGYLLGLSMCGITGKKAHAMADKAITREIVENVLDTVDPVTKYRFTTEMERKAYRLAEALETGIDRNAEIDRALKAWTKQLAQYAIDMTDYAWMLAFEDAGIKLAEWVTQRDGKVCIECRQLDGEVFPLEDFPPKPHMGCRCQRRPVRETGK